jgi:NAD(P)H-dependent FMN reductase
MEALKIAVIVGSTRPARNGKAVADWVMSQAQDRPDARYELVDLADHPLPLLDEPVPAAISDQYTNDHTKAWASVIAGYDGFVFVTPEYNHSMPGALKNAIDYLYNEWNNKAAAFVSYGTVGGARSVEHLRGVCSELQIAHVRQQLAFSRITDFQNYFETTSTFTPADYYKDQATMMFDQLESWALALQPLRALTSVAN